MQLDRDINDDGFGKYALLKLRQLALCRSDKTFEKWTPEVAKALETLEAAGILDWGRAETEAEFFVIRLKDEYAKAALRAYARAAHETDPEWSIAVHSLADRAGPDNPWCQKPD